MRVSRLLTHNEESATIEVSGGHKGRQRLSLRVGKKGESGQGSWRNASELRPGEGATFLGRKTAEAFKYHRGNSEMVGRITRGHATGQWQNWSSRP